MNMPITIANTGPPITGIMFPTNHDGTAIKSASKMPGNFFFMTSPSFPIISVQAESACTDFIFIYLFLKILQLL